MGSGLIAGIDMPVFAETHDCGDGSLAFYCPGCSRIVCTRCSSHLIFHTFQHPCINNHVYRIIFEDEYDVDYDDYDVDYDDYEDDYEDDYVYESPNLHCKKAG